MWARAPSLGFAMAEQALGSTKSARNPPKWREWGPLRTPWWSQAQELIHFMKPAEAAAQGTPGERCSRFRCARPISEPACSQPLSTRDIGRTASVRSLVRPSRAFRVVVPRCCSCALCCWGLLFRPCAGGATFLLGQARASVDAHLTSPHLTSPHLNAKPSTFQSLLSTL